MDELNKNDELNNIDINKVNIWKLSGTHFCKIQKVYDGDTPTIIIKINKDFFAFNVRLIGLDTPEIHPKNENLIEKETEHLLGIKARNKLIELVTDQSVIIDKKYTNDELKIIFNNNKKIITAEFSEEQDKYKRPLVKLYDKSTFINQVLIDQHYAKSYDGTTKEKWV
jgi:endonuclease YncB( thermonuclease family)